MPVLTVRLSISSSLEEAEALATTTTIAQVAEAERAAIVRLLLALTLVARRLVNLALW
jgi:hypothetical protein